jgi:molecular chaperone DnaK (HSP70)
MGLEALKDADLEQSDITEVVLVGGSARIPYIQQKLRETFPGREPRTDVNPDEAVGVGAALYADTIFNKADSTVRATYRLRDVTALALGIRTKGDVFSVIVPRNSPLPISCTEKYTTVVDDQVQ